MKKFLAFLSACLALLMLASPFVSVAASASSEQTDLPDNPLNYSSDNPYALRAVISPADLLTLLIESGAVSGEASDAELAYLDRYFDDYLSYDGALPANLISAELDTNQVTVLADAYSYVGVNGKTVTYLPVRASVGGVQKTMSFHNGMASAVFSEPDETADLSQITVFYQGSISLSKEQVNDLVTVAYRHASEALETDQALIAYTVALREYQEYLAAMEQYETDTLKYQSYLSAKALYDRAKAEYDQNLRDWEIYHQNEAKYQAYLAAEEVYRLEKAQYDRDLAVYEQNTEVQRYMAYLNQMNSVRTALAPMESLFIKQNDGRSTLYQALQNGDIVRMFEKYKDLLVKSFGVNAQTISNLRKDADHLNALLAQYAEKRAISEEAAFAFYQANYTVLCTMFNSLYNRMTEILTPTIYVLMCSKMELEYPEDKGAYKKWRLKNVVCHVYRICLCLDDARTPKNTWTFYSDVGDVHTYYFSDLLDQQVIITDSNAANPAKLSWPKEVPAPSIQPPTIPTPPVKVSKPVTPPTLSEPSAPTPVAQPLRPNTVEEPQIPSESDHARLLRTEEICLALMEGTLPERQLVTEDVTIDLTPISVSRRISLDPTRPAVSIFGAKGILLSATDPSALPTPSATSNELPLTFEDAYYTYTFSGWSEASARGLGDRFIYAQYTATNRIYRATFVIDGITVGQVDTPFGQIPRFEGSTEKESTETTDYHFTTWNPPLSAIREDTVFEAQYLEQDRKYSITFDLGNQTISRQYLWQETPVCPLEPSSYLVGGTLYEFIGWDKEFALVTENTVYTAQYKTTVLATLPDGSDGTLTISASDTTYTVVTSEAELSNLLIFSQAYNDGKRLELIFADRGVSMSFDATAIRALQKQKASSLRLEQDEEKGSAILIFNDVGANVELRTGQIHLRLDHNFPSAENIYVKAYHPSLDMYQSNIACTSSDTVTELIVSPGVYYKPYQEFTLTLKVGEYGQANVASSIYAADKPIELMISPNTNYRLDSLILINPNTGEAMEVDPDNLVMPPWNAVLEVNFAPIEYTIIFRYHGETLTQKMKLGDTVVFPEIPTSFEEDGFFYTFIGWSSSLTVVTGDMIYTANYYSVRVEEKAPSGEGSAQEAIPWKAAIPFAVILGIGTFLSIILPPIFVKIQFRKRRRHRS